MSISAVGIAVGQHECNVREGDQVCISCPISLKGVAGPAWPGHYRILVCVLINSYLDSSTRGTVSRDP